MWASLVSVLVRVTGSSGFTVGDTLSSGGTLWVVNTLVLVSLSNFMGMLAGLCTEL